MYYKRIIDKEIKKYLNNNKALIVTGMRRTGKTTLLRHFYDNISSNKVWFDFENPLDIKHFEDIDYNDVLENIINQGNLDRKKRIYVFIDEVQLYPEISKVVKYLIDHHNIKFLLTGSSSYYLKNLFPESLSGRKILFNLYPLNFEEFLVFKGLNAKKYQAIKNKKKISELDYELYDKQYEEYAEWGGFPEVVLRKNKREKKEELKDIFSSYFQNEVIRLADFGKNKKVRDLIILLSARVGSQLDIVKLSQELGITRVTVYSYLSFLEATFFIHLLSPYSRSVDREVSGTQKVYFCDNGILKILAEINPGQKFENLVYNQLKFKGNLHYYRKRTGAEVDFILDKKTCYEAKTKATEKDVKELSRNMEHVKLKEGYLISQAFNPIDKIIKYGQFI